MNNKHRTDNRAFFAECGKSFKWDKCLVDNLIKEVKK